MFQNCQNFQDFSEIFKEPRADENFSAQRLFRNTSKSRFLGSRLGSPSLLVITLHGRGFAIGAVTEHKFFDMGVYMSAQNLGDLVQDRVLYLSKNRHFLLMI